MDPGNLVPIAKVSDFKDKRFKTFKLLGKNVAIFKESDGTFFAMEVTCKHQGADLTEGKLEGNILTCPRHQWRYDISTGECLTNPTTLPLRRHALEIHH